MALLAILLAQITDPLRIILACIAAWVVFRAFPTNNKLLPSILASAIVAAICAALLSLNQIGSYPVGAHVIRLAIGTVSAGFWFFVASIVLRKRSKQ